MEFPTESKPPTSTASSEGQLEQLIDKSAEDGNDTKIIWHDSVTWESVNTRYSLELQHIYKNTNPEYGKRLITVMEAYITHIFINDTLDPWDEAFDILVETLGLVGLQAGSSEKFLFNQEAADLHAEACTRVCDVLGYIIHDKSGWGIRSAPQ